MTLEHLKEKKAILFDLDGTLVDSMWMWKEIDIEYLGKFGLNCPEDLQKVIEGMSFSETAVYFKNRFQLEDSLEQIKQDWISMSLYKYCSGQRPGIWLWELQPATGEKWWTLCWSL